MPLLAAFEVDAIVDQISPPGDASADEPAADAEEELS